MLNNITPTGVLVGFAIIAFLVFRLLCGKLLSGLFKTAPEARRRRSRRAGPER